MTTIKTPEELLTHAIDGIAKFDGDLTVECRAQLPGLRIKCVGQNHD
jgi:hypothetical protein